MPATSSKQLKAMYAAKAGKSTLGIPAKVGLDFVNATPKKKKIDFMKGKSPSSSPDSKGLGKKKKNPFENMFAKGKKI